MYLMSDSHRHYCDNATTSYEDMINNKLCDAGQYCDEGLKSQSESRDCRAGHYCPEGTPVEEKCPTGTYNNFTRKESIRDCLPCIAG